MSTPEEYVPPKDTSIRDTKVILSDGQAWRIGPADFFDLMDRGRAWFEHLPKLQQKSADFDFDGENGALAVTFTRPRTRDEKAEFLLMHRKSWDESQKYKQQQATSHIARLVSEYKELPGRREQIAATLRAAGYDVDGITFPPLPDEVPPVAT